MPLAKLFDIWKHPAVRLLTPAIAGFLAYGTWGFYWNHSYGLDMGLRAGLVQGTISFTLTLTMNSIMEKLFVWLRVRWLTVLMSVVSVITVSASAHLFNGTPEILLTIAPGTIIGSFYIFLYITALQKVTE